MARESEMPTPLDRVGTYAGRTLEVLRTMILDGTLKSGERINEVQLAQALGISRGPLREAIQRLASEGLVEAVSHRGSFVRSFGAKELADLYELRIALETHAVRLIARGLRDETIDDLTSILGAAESRLKSDSGLAYPSDLDFHMQLVALPANDPLMRAATEVGRQIRLARSRSAQQPDRALHALDEHQAIVSALADGDSEAAAALLSEHLHRSLNNALSLLEDEAMSKTSRV